MEIEVVFQEDGVKKRATFESYEALGVWISNNYENVIFDIVVSEE